MTTRRVSASPLPSQRTGAIDLTSNECIMPAANAGTVLHGIDSSWRICSGGRQGCPVAATPTTSRCSLFFRREKQLCVLANAPDCHRVVRQITEHNAVGKTAVDRYDQTAISVVPVELFPKFSKS